MIVVTGAAGFIGSCLVSGLNKAGQNDIVVVDDFSKTEKEHNLEGKKISQKVERNKFIAWLEENAKDVEFVFHLGARTDTTEFDRDLLNELNLHFSQEVWKVCAKHNIDLVYASSAATYGMGQFGYDDTDMSLLDKLIPLNPYGDSKNDFDKWVLQQKDAPSFWAGLKFFNVYGPNEYHKGRMASVILHAFKQIGTTEGMKLFRSHNPKYSDGGQLRDFIYVKDVISVCLFLQKGTARNGIYNLGTGTARTFLDLAKSTFSALEKTPQIEFIDTPEDIRDKYQYFTEAKMQKLKDAGYKGKFYTLEEGVKDYVTNYLLEGKYF